MSDHFSRQWYEKGLGLRTKLAPLHRLLRFFPGREGREAYVRWIDHNRKERMQETIAAFEAAVDRLSDEDIVLDLGANVGDYTAKLARTGAQVHAFEPEPRLFANLGQRFEGASNVFLYQAAISAEAGMVKLWLENSEDANPLGLQSHSIVEGGALTTEGKTIEVECIDFFTFLENLGGAPAIVKMDIEGAEVAILERLFKEDRLNEIGALFVETHEQQIPVLKSRTVALHRQARASGAINVNLFWP